jgi:hypothetical protein
MFVSTRRSHWIFQSSTANRQLSLCVCLSVSVATFTSYLTLRGAACLHKPIACSLLYNRYRVIPGVKRPGRGVEHPPPSSAEVKERVEHYLYSPSGTSWPVLWWTLPLPVPYISLLFALKCCSAVPQSVALSDNDWKIFGRGLTDMSDTQCHFGQPCAAENNVKLLVWLTFPDLRKIIVFCKVPRSRPFVLLVREKCTWRWV